MTGGSFTTDSMHADYLAAVVFRGALGPGQSVRVHKFLSHHYSDNAAPQQVRSQTAWTLDRAIKTRSAPILERQRSDVGRFWSRADVAVETENPRTQQVIRWNLFQLLQASERAEGHGIPARGLTGRTYEGHYFWDTEIDVLPFLAYTRPWIARSLLKYRYDMLDKARARARELGHRGPPFPGGPSTVRRPRLTMPQEPRSTTSMRTLPMHYESTWKSAATRTSSCVTGPKSSWRRRVCGGSWLFLRAERRALLHQWRDRAGRVHGTREQQLLYQPDGAGKSALRRRDGP